MYINSVESFSSRVYILICQNAPTSLNQSYKLIHLKANNNNPMQYLIFYYIIISINLCLFKNSQTIMQILINFLFQMSKMDPILLTNLRSCRDLVEILFAMTKLKVFCDVETFFKNKIRPKREICWQTTCKVE